MINKKRISENIELKKFMFDCVTLYEKERYGRNNEQMKKRLYKILEEGNHFTDKTQGVYYSLEKSGSIWGGNRDKYRIYIYEQQHNQTQTFLIEFDKEKLREELNEITN